MRCTKRSKEFGPGGPTSLVVEPGCRTHAIPEWLPRPHHGPSVAGAGYLASPIGSAEIHWVFLLFGRFGRGVELGVFGREWREGDGFAVGRPLPLDHLPWLLGCEGGLNGLVC